MTDAKREAPVDLGSLLDHLAKVQRRLGSAFQQLSSSDRETDLDEVLQRTDDYTEAKEAVLSAIKRGTAETTALKSWQRDILERLRREEDDRSELAGTQIASTVFEALVSVGALRENGAEATERREEEIETVEMRFDLSAMAQRIPRVPFSTIPHGNIALRRVLDEAAMAYCAGLFSATALLCRTALEVCLRDRLSADNKKDLGALITEAKHAGILRNRGVAARSGAEANEVDVARLIQREGRDWAHGFADPEQTRSSEDLLDLYWDTVSLLEAISVRRPNQRQHQARPRPTRR